MAIIPELIADFKYMLGYRNKTIKVQRAMDANAPKVGEIAPDFTLLDSAGENAVTLSDFRGELPVALIFGSFT